MGFYLFARNITNLIWSSLTGRNRVKINIVIFNYRIITHQFCIKSFDVVDMFVFVFVFFSFFLSLASEKVTTGIRDLAAHSLYISLFPSLSTSLSHTHTYTHNDTLAHDSLYECARMCVCVCVYVCVCVCVCVCVSVCVCFLKFKV